LHNLRFLAAAAFCIASLPLLAQQNSPHSFAPLSAGERIPNLDTLKDRVRQYHDCKHGCYSSDLDLQADRAIKFLLRRASHRRTGEKLAVVFDIDETTLSNYEEMLKVGFAYDANAFNAWVDQASAPAIPGTLRIFKQAQQLNVSVFFLTGRPEKQREATERNLKSQGCDSWQQLILRAPEQSNLTAVDYKSAARAGIIAQGYTLVLNVGDQWSDLRGRPEAEYSVKYPDPYYFIR
jgi:acid phosphatase